MPMSVNVGLSRKASKDYQSTGVSINVTAELDSALLQRPEALQAQIDFLYREAEIAIDRPVKACADNSTPQAPERINGNGRIASDGTNGQHHSNGHRNGDGMTNSQRKAIEAIARRAN